MKRKLNSSEAFVRSAVDCPGSFSGVEVEVESKIDGETQVKRLRFPYCFLRDNCSSNFHKHTWQRLTAVNAQILNSKGTSSVENNSTGTLKVAWKDRVPNDKVQGEYLADVSSFTAEWLLEHSLERTDRIRRRTAPYEEIEQITPSIFFATDQVDCQRLLQDDAELLRFMDRLATHGLVYLKNIAASGTPAADHVEQFVRRISFLRETNYGRFFEVYSKSNPNNQAYTSQLLPLHTDLPFYRFAPDVQMLCCAKSECVGGNSWFIDGVAAATLLKERHPESYALLRTKKVQFSDTNEAYHLYNEKAVIQESECGQIYQLFWNEGVRCHILNSCEPEEVHGLYKAFVDLQAVLDEKELKIDFKMAQNCMCVFNNNRVLHGRGEFSSLPGEKERAGEISRHLIGAYIDWDDFWSKRRILKKKVRQG